MTVSSNGFPILENEWWCGCYPDIKFTTEYEFVKHMQSKKHNWKRRNFLKIAGVIHLNR